MSTPLRLVLDSTSLEPFVLALDSAGASLRDAQDRAAAAYEAERRLALLGFARTPDFVRERLELVPGISGLVRDERWDAPDRVANDLAGALAYFSDQCDLIPDANPQFGLLDDALVIELALRRHLDEWREWHRFDALRQRQGGRFGLIARADWFALAEHRRERMLARPEWNRFARSGSRASLDGPFRVH